MSRSFSEGNETLVPAQGADDELELLRIKLMAFAKLTLRSHDAARDALIMEGIALTGDAAVQTRAKPCLAALDAMLQDKDLVAQVAAVASRQRPEVRQLKEFLLSGLRALVACARRAAALGKRSYHVNYFFYQALAIMAEDCPTDTLLSLAAETGKVHYLCMQMLEAAQADQTPTVPDLTAQLLRALQDEQIKQVCLLGSNDATAEDRAYFSAWIAQAPAQSLLLLLQDEVPRLDRAGELPRLLPLGRACGAYKAIAALIAVATQLGKGLHELPLSLACAGAEDETVGLLLCLLTLQKSPLYVGPTRPAALTDAVLALMQARFGLTAAGTAQNDMAGAG